MKENKLAESIDVVLSAVYDLTVIAHEHGVSAVVVLNCPDWEAVVSEGEADLEEVIRSLQEHKREHE